MKASTLFKQRNTQESHWLSVSDLMSGLMMVFLCISVAMMHSVLIERDKIRQVAVSYRDTQLAIYQSLVEEFSGDLKRWGASIDRDTLTIIFQTNDTMFATGSREVSIPYQTILAEFFPRYINVLLPFQGAIEEIRLEGHTSSEWQQSEEDAYFKNLSLSQDRTRSVLEYVSQLSSSKQHKNWITQHIAAVGYSSSRLIKDASGKEDKERSKRVAFRVITNSEMKIKHILEETL